VARDGLAHFSFLMTTIYESRSRQVSLSINIGAAPYKRCLLSWRHSVNLPFRKAEALNDLDILLTVLNEEFLADLTAKSIRRVWDKKTRDPFKEVWHCSTIQTSQQKRSRPQEEASRW
jgi:hypothetical protein